METNKMLEHFVQEWERDDVYIIIQNGEQPKMSLSYDDIEVLDTKHHLASIEWRLKICGSINMAVVKNQHGYHIEQLAFD